MPADIIRVISFDYDGCLEHCFINGELNTEVGFLKDLVKSIHPGAKVILLCGSIRQSKVLDIKNAVRCGNGLAVDALEKLASWLNSQLSDKDHPDRVHFDPYLLQDSVDKLPAGSHVKKIRELSSEKYQEYLQSSDYKNDFKQFYYDPTKITLLYAQMLYIRSRYPQQKIQFEFYDDVIEPILENLEFFYTDHRSVPKKFTLSLFPFDKYSPDFSRIRSLFDIEGTGEANDNYQDFIVYSHKQLSSLRSDESAEFDNYISIVMNIFLAIRSGIGIGNKPASSSANSVTETLESSAPKVTTPAP